MCRGTECFSESLGIRDNERRLYIENFTSQNWKFLDKYSDVFHISVQNTGCRGEAVPTSTHNLCFEQKLEKKYTPVNTGFTI